MELSEFTFKIILLFIPGLISFIIFDALTSHPETKLHRVLIESLLFGFMSYFVYFLYTELPFIDTQFSFLDTLTIENATLDFAEILKVSGLSILIALIFSFMSNRKWLYKISRKFRITGGKHGYVDLWSYVMDSDIPNWVIIRDIGNDLMYEGWVEGFSDSTEIDELFIRDVLVYKNSSGKLLYSSPALYIPTKRQNLTIEFPRLNFTDAINRPPKEEEKEKDRDG